MRLRQNMLRKVVILACIAPLLVPHLAVAAEAATDSPSVDSSQWRRVRSVTADFGSRLSKAEVTLLKSVDATGTSGIDDPLHAVNLVVVAAGKVVYSFFSLDVSRHDEGTDSVYQVDDALELRDLTGDGVPEIVFHSGFLGASDRSIIVHVLQCTEAGPVGFRDIRAASFVDSWWKGVRFAVLNRRAFAVIAEPVDPAVAEGDFVSHGQPRFHRYLVYGWDVNSGRFELLQTIPDTRHLHDDAEAGFEVDWPYILSAVKDAPH